MSRSPWASFSAVALRRLCCITDIAKWPRWAHNLVQLGRDPSKSRPSLLFSLEHLIKGSWYYQVSIMSRMQCRQSTDNCKIKLETLYHCTAAFIATRKHTGTGAVEKGKAGQGSDKAVIRGPTRTSGTGQGLDAWTSSLHRVEKKGHTDDKAWTKWRRPTARPRLSRGGHQDTGRRTAGETPRGHQENTGLASAAKGGHEEGPQAWDTGFGQRLGENPNRKLFGENLIALIREWFKDLAEFLLWCRKADIPPFPSAIGIVAIGKKPTKESETDEKAQQN